MESPCGPAVPLSGIYPKDLKTGASTGICTPVSTAAGSTAAKRWRQPTRKSSEQTNTVSTRPVEYDSAVERREVLTLSTTTRMDLEYLMLRERSQTHNVIPFM